MVRKASDDRLIRIEEIVSNHYKELNNRIILINDSLSKIEGGITVLKWAFGAFMAIMSIFLSIGIPILTHYLK